MNGLTAQAVVLVKAKAKQTPARHVARWADLLKFAKQKNMLSPLAIASVRITKQTLMGHFYQWEQNASPRTGSRMQLPAIFGKVARDYCPNVTLPVCDLRQIDNRNIPQT